MRAPRSRTGASPRAGPRLLAYLPPTAVICGATVMMVEVLGARLIGPFFGVSLFVWTALIGVTLVALALGCFIGGLAADRVESPDYLYAAIILAGVLVAAIPLLEAPVLKASVPLGLRAGALASALCLFAPALVLLGAVSPWLLRIAAHEVHSLGRIAGGLYGLSTLGSLAGTLATGFFLIGVLGVHRIFQLGGTALIALGVLYFLWYRRKWAVSAALAWPLLVAIPAAPVERQMSDGTRVRLVHSRDSFYGSVKVVDYVHATTHTRELIIDGLVQGGMDLRSGQSVYEYAYLLEHLPLRLHPLGRRCLVIGLGAGLVPRSYLARGIETHAVDIDPEVVAAARTWFALDPGITVFVADARYHLASTRARYDYVVLDVFNGDTTPGHLLSREAMQLIRARLTERGVLAVNLVGDIGPDGAMTASVVRTLREVFERVQVHPAFEPERDGPVGNLVLVAQSGPAPAVRAQEAVPVHSLAQRGVHYGLAHQVEPQAWAQSMVLTDDFNPIDLRDLALKERVRRRILDTTHWDVLLARAPGPRELTRTDVQ